MQEVEPTLPTVALKIREKMRHCFVYFGNAHGSSWAKRQQARNLVRDFLKSTAEYWVRVQRFNRYIHTVEHIRARVRRTMSARHAQWELLEEFFHKERKSIHAYLKLNKKNMKDRDFAETLVRKLTDIPFASVRETLSDYMDACRVQLREVQKEINSKRQRGVAFQCFMLLDAIKDTTLMVNEVKTPREKGGADSNKLMRKSTIDFKKEIKTEGYWYDNLCPLRILTFEEI